MSPIGYIHICDGRPKYAGHDYVHYLKLKIILKYLHAEGTPFLMSLILVVRYNELS